MKKRYTINTQMRVYDPTNEQPKYALYVVEPDEVHAGYMGHDEVRESAIEVFYENELSAILAKMVQAVNDGEYSDQNYYVVTDNQEQVILYS